MRELSSETVAAIREAREAAWSRRGGPGGAPVRTALEQVAASGEWAAIPHVLAMVLDPLPAVSEAACRAVQALLHAVPVHELPRLDQLARARSSWSWGDLDAWLALSPRELDRLASLPEGPSLLQLATMHPSGFVREAAIRRTAVCSDGREAPCYVLRLNDWVGPVRGAAVAALRARLHAACADELVAALPLLDVARRWGRIDAPTVLAELEAFVVGPAAASALRAALDAPERATRRAAFRRAFASAIPAAEVIERAIREPDALVRGRAVDALRADGAIDATRPLGELLRDPVGGVRARALELALDRGVPVELDPFLFDAHVGVRSLAQAALLAADVDVLAR